MKLDDEDCFMIRSILRKLHNLKVFGGKHKSVVRVYRSVPVHLRGQAKDIVDFLVKKGFLLAKFTVEDKHIRLAEVRLTDIRKICVAYSANEIKAILEKE